jgi:hypothetical protein
MQVSARHGDTSPKQHVDQPTSYAVASATPTLMDDDEDMVTGAVEPDPSCRDSMILSGSSLSSALPAQGSRSSEWRNMVTSQGHSGIAHDATSGPVLSEPPKLMPVPQMSPDEVRKVCRMNRVVSVSQLVSEPLLSVLLHTT